MDCHGSVGGLPRACCSGPRRNELSDRRYRLTAHTISLELIFFLAFSVVFKEGRDEARKLDAEFAKTEQITGPLHGVPITVKDMCASLCFVSCHDIKGNASNKST